ncbi:hypothetical protein [Algoriphagus sp.]|uniref:hypothetical protein n=1 Tax=Algoriphagus sp. TaxID=1872435 RepID=UPI0025E02857|nr:hypothetical protein [Algoriphagus sp.]
MRINGFFIGTLLSLILASCNPASQKSENTLLEVPMTEEIPESNPVLGNYVSDGYSKKSEGYDWVSVAVTALEGDKIKIIVRSRADKKRPTCTFDATAEKVDENTYKSWIEDQAVFYNFNGNQLTIALENPENEGVLSFYCSGGATVAGSYMKIEGELDSSQIDPTAFNKTMMLQGIGFNISSVEKDGKTLITVMPFGLEISNETVTLETSGQVTNAEIEDLNSDGSPEVMIYTQTTEENKYGNVLGFSTNNKKSMSQTYFPPISENEELSKGYQGHDEFAIVETHLVQRFPIFENGKKTEKIRQISYKLKEGEAIRGFQVDKVSEY